MVTPRRYDCEAHHASNMLRDRCPHSCHALLSSPRRPSSSAGRMLFCCRWFATVTSHASVLNHLWAAYLLQGVSVLQFSPRVPVGASALREPPQLSAAAAISHACRSRAETSGGWPAGACNTRDKPAVGSALVVRGGGRSMHCTTMQTHHGLDWQAKQHNPMQCFSHIAPKTLSCCGCWQFHAGQGQFPLMHDSSRHD